MQSGDHFRQYSIGPQIGEGGFSKIFAVRDNESGLVYALKHESNHADRKTLKYETQVLKRVQGMQYSPSLFEFGLRNQGCWCIMELCGPSLQSILKTLPGNKFSLSTALRTSKFVLRALRELHDCGFIHRDISPSNILVRIQTQGPPLCLIDYGLSRMIRDPHSNKPISARQSAGFRGAKSYVSIRAHYNQDLSKRDDLISWFYFTVDIMLGGLPWKGRASEEDVICLKQNWDIRQALESIAPQLVTIWESINQLEFETEPNYNEYMNIIETLCQEQRIYDSDAYDWEDYVQKYTQQLAEAFGEPVRVGGAEAKVRTFREELGISPALKTSMKMKTPLISSQPQISYQSFTSQIDMSEVHEQPRHFRWCCN